MAGLLDGVFDAASRILAPLMSSESPICIHPDSFHPPVVQLITPYSSLMHPNIFSPLETETSTKTTVHGWMSKAMFSRDSKTAAKMGFSWFMGYCRVHNCDGGLDNYYLGHRQASSPRILWHMAINPTVPTMAILSVDRCQTIVVERQDEGHLV